MRIRIFAAAIGLTVATTMLISSPAAADPGPVSSRFMWNPLTITSNCFYMKADRSSALWHCNTSYVDQYWDTVAFAEGLYTLRNYHSGLCLSSNTKTVGAALTAQTCDTSANGGQHAAQDEWIFILVGLGGGRYGWRIRNIYSGLCLLVKGGATGVTATQYTCQNYSDQLWA